MTQRTAPNDFDAFSSFVAGFAGFIVVGLVFQSLAAGLLAQVVVPLGLYVLAHVRRTRSTAKLAREADERQTRFRNEHVELTDAVRRQFNQFLGRREPDSLARESLSMIASEHAATLARHRRRCLDEYGSLRLARWRNELERFVRSAVLGRGDAAPAPESYFVVGTGSREYLEDWVVETVDDVVREFEKGRLPPSIASTSSNSVSGQEYELLCVEALRVSGWDARVTSASGDQGVDVVATRGRHILVLQCKHYTHAVGNKAVQEVIAGRVYYHADHAGVVAPHGFTRSAVELARSADVLLLREDDLGRLDRALRCACAGEGVGPE